MKGWYKGMDWDMMYMGPMGPMGPMPMMGGPMFFGKGYMDYGKGPMDPFKGFGKGGYPAPKEAKGLVRSIVSSQVVPGTGGKWNNDENTLFVGGLPPDTTNLEMYQIFSAFGPIAPRGATALLDKDTGQCTGIGFINYMTAEAAEKAIRSLNSFPFTDGTQAQRRQRWKVKKILKVFTKGKRLQRVIAQFPLRLFINANLLALSKYSKWRERGTIQAKVSFRPSRGTGETSRFMVASLHHVDASFIRRCWWPERSCGESSACSDMRSLWENAEKVDHLPPPAECENPKYLVTGSRKRFGVLGRRARLETLTFPNEEWHKCCMVNDGKQMLCEDVKAMPPSEIVNQHHGMCGTHACMGADERCLHVDHQEEELTQPKKGQCPGNCHDDCIRSSERLECIHLGEITQEAGTEGHNAQFVRGDFKQPEKYEVFSMSMPAVPWLTQPDSAQFRRTARRKSWERFLRS
ncbi:Rbms3 [Symbiodinium sp. KB8]|nr:Rbms3 [Symbiodinium sp. KB8]